MRFKRAAPETAEQPTAEDMDSPPFKRSACRIELRRA
jgi:hypothetical protein